MECFSQLHKDIIGFKDTFCSDHSLPDILQNRGVEWKSVKDIDENAKFLSLDTVPYNRRFEVKQGEYGGGYFLAAVAGLTGYPDMFKAMFSFTNKFIGHPDPDNIHYKFNRMLEYWDLCVFEFYRDGVEEYVLVDYRLPILEGKLVFAQAVDGNYWCPLAEKAYAKFMGGYNNLTLGLLIETLTHLTNQYGLLLATENMSNDALFFKLDDKIRKKSIVCCKSKHKNDNNGEYGRSFTITGVNQNNGDYMIRLKDPKETKEFWIGASKFKEEYDFIFYTSENKTRMERTKPYIEFDDFDRYTIRSMEGSSYRRVEKQYN